MFVGENYLRLYDDIEGIVLSHLFLVLIWERIICWDIYRERRQTWRIIGMYSIANIAIVHIIVYLYSN